MSRIENEEMNTQWQIDGLEIWGRKDELVIWASEL